MHDNVDVLHEIVTNTWSGEIPSDSHRKQISIFFPTGFHLVGLGLGPRGGGDLDPTFKEKVDYVGAHETRGTGDENMAEKRADPLSGPDLRRLKEMVLTEGQTLYYGLLWMELMERPCPSALLYRQGSDPRYAAYY